MGILMSHAHLIILKDFRGISHLEYHPSQINIITGPNNSGKTSLLDAISIFYRKEIKGSLFSSDPFFKQPSYNIHHGSERSLLSIDGEEVYLFKTLKEVKKFDSKKEQQIHEAIISELGRQYLNERLPPERMPEYIQAIFDEFLYFVILWRDEFVAYPVPEKSMNQTFHKFELLFSKPEQIKSGQKTIYSITLNPQVILKTNEISSSLIIQIGHDDKRSLSLTDEKDLILLEQIIKENELIPNFERLSQNMITYRHENELISLPISSYGDGFVTMLETIHQLLKAKGGILLIEEPENHLHPRYIQVFVDTVMNYSGKMDIQVFMSTHSYDLIDEFLQSSESSDKKGRISVLRLAKEDDMLISTQYDVSEALQVTQELLLDLRGV